MATRDERLHYLKRVAADLERGDEVIETRIQGHLTKITEAADSEDVTDEEVVEMVHTFTDVMFTIQERLGNILLSLERARCGDDAPTANP